MRQKLIELQGNIEESFIILEEFNTSLSEMDRSSPDQCGSVGWASSCKVKGHRLDYRSGHMPGLQVQSRSGAYKRQLITVSLPFFLPPFFLPLSLKINNKTFILKKDLMSKPNSILGLPPDLANTLRKENDQRLSALL